ncbi:FIG00953934: hypothetical protein [hydrothermal vent metagenome]|uniref:DUF2797 domain-containing protein n=1 Tax=hydrothermal vent metagenome TaxID=652676 RepID=A0A1W1CVF6_9ZZZZ
MKINYQLPLGDKLIDLNPLLGSNIKLEWTGSISCANCGSLTKKSWSQGFCWPCSQELASCDMCMMKPETCHFHLGTCREPKWGEENCFSEHIIYLANSSGVKVGITRNVPTRWIDQGAVSSLPILKVDTRLKSGEIETALKPFIADKTNWRKMLKNEVESVDLVVKRDELLAHISNVIEKTQAIILDEEVLNFEYPVLEYPTKIISLNFDKTPIIEGRLMGIKGQYLLLDSGVLNIRKFSGYNIKTNILT